MKYMDMLDIKINHSDFDKDLTIRGYFHELLLTLWMEGEEFSGKRPFGNSGWEYDIYTPLIKAGVIEGTLDEDGYIQEFDNKKADKLVLKLISTAINY